MNRTKPLLPEEQELERKRAELEDKRTLLADRELELATIRSALNAFEQVYLEKVGRLYVELDELQAQLASLRAAQLGDNDDSSEKVRQAQQQAGESRAEYERRKEVLGPPIERKEPSQELKSLYRRLAKQFHPDGSLDPQEKTQRSVIMAQINEAYARGDVATLQRMDNELAISPEAVSGEGIGVELIRVIRKMAQIDGRLATLEQEIVQLQESELFQLRAQHEESTRQGRDLLDALAVGILRRIAETRAQIAVLTSSAG